MKTKIISVEPNNYFIDPESFKQEFSIKIEKRLSSFQKQKRLLQRLNNQSALRRHKKQEISGQKISTQKDSFFSSGDVSADALMPFIDSAMKLQQNAYEAAMATNRAYQVQLLLIFLEAFISIIFNFYYMISVIVEPSAFKLPTAQSIAYLAQHLIQPCLCVLVTVCGFALVKHTFLEFSQQIQSNIPRFSVFGFFPLDGSVIFSMISATTTYLIILVQTLGSQSQTDPIFAAYAKELNQSDIH